MSQLSREDAHYNDEANFLDDLLAFHPELFSHLRADAFRDLQKYYALGVNLDEDFREYRRTVVAADPGIAKRAADALTQVCQAAGVDHVVYTTKWSSS